MEVTGTDFSGPLLRWNEGNPALRVHAGDRLVAVNGKTGTRRMLAQLQDAAALEGKWVVVRGACPVPAEPDVECGPLRKREGEKLGIRVGGIFEAPVRGGTLVPAGACRSRIVKEVVPGHAIDQWNRRAGSGGASVVEGATVVSV
eukprot:CAMPEP_0179275116 /NCGR_PEP_ID=MMETSP0797-20121207/33894_1 /TAXON_ID=47934 /ORGANISM="Dinophysis acuminata, Strain DAEP01" /LENGTH=144 /DNA_ID=CAMNT_0020983627 /DNA_START=60 /DNA_END=490 /DNA_ORIENTATION=-